VVAQDGAVLADEFDDRFTYVSGRCAWLLGDAMPEPPAGWSPNQAISSDRATPFGQLRVLVHEDGAPVRHESPLYRLHRSEATLAGSTR
jgi:hypothetical protein